MLKIRILIHLSAFLMLLSVKSSASNFTFEGKLENLEGNSFKINRNGIFNNIFETIKTDSSGVFYYQSELLSNEAFSILIGEKVFTLYIEPGEHIKFKYDAASQKLISLRGATSDQTDRYNFDYNYNLEMMSDVLILFKSLTENPKFSQDSVFNTFQTNLDSYSRKIYSKKKLLGSKAFKYYGDLYFTHLEIMKNAKIKNYERLRFKDVNDFNLLSELF